MRSRHKSEKKMAQTTKLALVAALAEYKRLLDTFGVLIQASITADAERRQRVYTMLLPSPEKVLKTGTEWEVMLQFDDRTFSRHLRVNKSEYDYLVSILQDIDDEEQHNPGRSPIPIAKIVLMFLWYMANQNSFREISDKFDISQSSAHRHITEVLRKMSTLGHRFISWPNMCEKMASDAAFYRLCGLRGIIGAIDGCHVKVQRPPIRGGDYLNRKTFYSVLLQGIVDERGRFIDIFAGPPGKVHDARMLRASDFFAAWQDHMGDYKLLGDSAYIGQAFPFIVTPKRDNGALTEEEEQQNSRISRGRVIVENAFGRMKCRWRRLRDLQNTRIDLVVMIIMSACFLHNLCTSGSEICHEHPNGCPRHEDDNE